MTSRYFFILGNMKSVILYSIAVSVAVLLLSCERQDETAIDTNFSYPFISSATLVATVINLDDPASANSQRLPDGSYSIKDSITAMVRIPAGADIDVGFRIIAPAGAGVVQSGH